MHITYFIRRSRPGAFSIENLFLTIQHELPGEVTYTNHFLSKQSNGLKNRLMLIWEAFQNKGQINHITGDINFIALLLPKSKTILTIHDIESLERKNRLSNFLLQYFWLRMPVARVKYITVVSQATKNKLLNELLIDPEKVVVIPNGISPEFTYQPKPFNKENAAILQVGTKYNKNLERTIEALEGIPCIFFIVGQLSKEQEQLLVKHKINFVNHVGITNEKLRDLYIEADIVTFVSLFEGFGMPILEAQATGRPVITSNCSSMPEVAGNGALLVDPTNVSEIRKGILKVIQDEEFRNELIAEGMENIKLYCNKVIVQQYLDLYQKL